MKCISPLLIRSDGRRDVVPCGKCNYCLQTRRSDWTFRLSQELKTSQSASFLTFTYDEGTVPKNDQSGLHELRKSDMQLFTKRLRQHQSRFIEASGRNSRILPIRFYTVGEYGTNTLRPHYHSIMFNMLPQVESKLQSIWTAGHIHSGKVTPASIAYVTKYVINRHADYEGREPPFSLMSRNPGIGSNYIATHKSWHRADMRNYTRVNGTIGRLPRFYKDKFFTDIEKKTMAKQTLLEGDNDYWLEIQRLNKFHSDPELYYEECIAAAHDNVKSKINVSNTF